jgi:hypothetical protein
MGKTAALLPTWPKATWDWIEMMVMLCAPPYELTVKTDGVPYRGDMLLLVFAPFQGDAP